MCDDQAAPPERDDEGQIAVTLRHAPAEGDIRLLVARLARRNAGSVFRLFVER
jgi:hypothetical protein